MYKILDLIIFVVLIPISKIGFLGYLIARELVDALMRCKKEGGVTELGMEKEDCEVEFKMIDKIEAGFERSLLLPTTILAKVKTDKGRQEICFEDKEIIKLVKTVLNNITICSKWDMDKKMISITKGDEHGMNISYTPAGKYAVAPYIINLIGLPVFASAVGALYFDLINLLGFYAVFIVLAIICFVLPYYKMMSVRMNQKGLTIKRTRTSERFIAFSDVVRVEKKIFWNIVVTKKEELIYFPKAFYLLPEFIIESK